MIIIYIIILWISAFFHSFVYSGIICSLFHGIPDVIKLKRKQILNKEASTIPYFISALFWIFICFIIFKLLENNISEDCFEAYMIGMLVAFFYSLNLFSKKESMYFDIMNEKRNYYGDIINDLFELSEITTNDILDIIVDNSIYTSDIYSDNKNFFVNITMINCFYLGICFFLNNGVIENPKEEKYLITALLLKLSKLTNTNYNLLNYDMYKIINDNSIFLNNEINEEMRILYVTKYLNSMIINNDIELINQEDAILDKYIDISNMFFSIVLGENVEECDDKGITLFTEISVIDDMLKKTTNKRDISYIREKEASYDEDLEEYDEDLEEYDEDLEEFYE